MLSEFDELNDIVNNCIFDNLLNENEFIDIYESILLLTDYFLDYFMIKMYEYNFHKLLQEYILNLLTIQFDSIYSLMFENILSDIVNCTIMDYFKYIIPPRQYKKTFIRNKNINKDSMEKKIIYLKELPQPPQREKEWYIFRYNLITASNAWKALISESSKNSLIFEKCSPLNLEKYNSVNTGSPFHWGNLFEPVSISIYEYKYNTIIEDFGCIKNKYDYLGASPDGINVKIDNDRYGRMLEVKNIVNREINGCPKREYWIQMQMQMNVCELNECDFLETKFTEYESEKDFLSDGKLFNKTDDGKYKGIILYFIKDGKPYYEYPDINLTKETFEIWEKEIMEKNKNYTWNKNIYWKLEIYSCVLVLRNKRWFKEVLPIFEKIWNIIEKERIEGFEHRAPKKKLKNVFVKEDYNEIKGKCFIKLNENTISNQLKSYSDKLKSSKDNDLTLQENKSQYNIIKIDTSNLTS